MPLDVSSGTGPSPRWTKPVLVGERVTLRALDAGDIDAVWEMVHDDEGNDLTATTATFDRAQIVEWCTSRPEQDERLDLAIVENTTGDFVGEVVLNEFDEDTNTASFRIALRGRDWYGRGLGTEATRLIVDYGLTAVGLAEIKLEVLARNPRAIAVYEKTGFTRIRAFDDDGESWFEMSIRT